MAAHTSVAVVIPTKDRTTLLRRCLQALTEQSLRADEVIVVDDGSREPVATSIADLADALPLRLVRLESSQGPAGARNSGWRQCVSELVAFTDDDCRPDQDWLTHLVAAARPGEVVVGRTTPDPRDGPIGSVFDRTFEAHGLSWGYSSCNVLYPRSMLQDLSGFDADFRHPWAEDTDLALRARALGAEGCYEPEAVVYHAVHRRGAWPTVRERWRTGQVVRVVRRNPNYQHEVFRASRFFWQSYHLQALGLCAGLALTPISPVFLLFGGPWYDEARGRLGLSVYNNRPLPPAAKRLMNLGGLALLDMVEVFSCAVWSFREGTLLL